MKILMVFGTRPEAIKLAPVALELQRRSVGTVHETLVCVTAQHREMLDQVLSVFGIVPSNDLDLMTDAQTPTQVAAAVLARLEPILASERPDWVVVQGDTTTVTAAAFAAFYAGVSVAHVEAGLRTGDRRQPFPEEINRRLASVLTDLHFPPTENARQNLLREGVAEDHIVVTGNPVIDALDWVRTLPPPADIVELSSRIGLDRPTDPPKLVLVTAHRRENFGAPLQEICLALRDLVERYGDGIHIVYPVHPNPNVTEPAYRLLADVPGVTLMAPLDYLSLAHLMERSYLVLTDSGGLQEEAPSMGKPVLVLRNVTERPEGVEAGAAKVVGAERRRIVEEASVLLDDKAAYDRMAQAVNPYGDGHAAERIAAALMGEHVTPFVSDTTVA